MESNINNSDLRVTPGMETNWRITSKWAMFFAVMGFIMAGLYLLSAMAIIPALRMMAAMGTIPEPVNSLIGSFSWVFVLLYLGALACVFFLALYHLRFSNSINRALNFTDQNAFSTAWRNLRNHFRLYGILTITFIALYLIMLVAVLVFVSKMAESGNNF
ncbi:MAG: hypothetical protein JNM22_22425 [Saprospiraceae bacterium]|nr:hypothetical protein [Saprospiraceae bacterium]